MYVQTTGQKVKGSRAVAHMNNNKIQLQTLVDNRPGVLAQGKIGSRNANPISPLQFFKKTTQRRVASADELGMTGDEGTADLFDTDLPTGKVFTKTISTPSDDTMSIIRSYIGAVRPVGNVATGFPGYTDIGYVNMTAQMPNMANWPGNCAVFLNNVRTQLGASEKGIEVFTSKPRSDALSWLQKMSSPYLRWQSNLFQFIDPFLVKFKFKNEITGQSNWEITTQFGESATGYIIKIKNGEKDITGSIVTRGDFTDLEDNDADNRNDYVYSSTHVQDNQAFKNKLNTLNSHSEGNKKGKYHEGLDAITWLAAEGARYKPVEALSSSAKPQSQFYVKPNRNNWNNARSVSLIWLMTNWGNHFNKEYGISASTIRQVVSVNGTAINGLPPKPRYNLTKERGET